MSSLLAFNFEMRAVPSKDVASFLKRGSNEAIRRKYHGWSEQESIGFGLAAHHDNGDDRPAATEFKSFADKMPQCQ
jgi:hypothetical protein